MSDNSKKIWITVMEALDLVTEATKKYVDETGFSGDYNDLYNKPDTIIADINQASNSQVSDMLSNIFDK